MRALRVGHMEPGTRLELPATKRVLDKGGIIEADGYVKCPECRGIVYFRAYQEGQHQTCTGCGYRFRPVAARLLTRLKQRGEL